MTRLVLLWHMHQPCYEDRSRGEYVLPWVRLHALKDYRGMVEILADYPRVRATFNLVPSLLTQLQAYGAGRARDPHQGLGEIPAETLSLTDRLRLVAGGFHGSYQRMAVPHARYAELEARRHVPAGEWPIDALRDLQVWRTLAWMDPDQLERDPRLVALVAKGRGFTEADKAVLANVAAEWLASTIPAYRQAEERGQVELSTSPFYHPMLPLLCDTDALLAACPDAEVPHPPFRWPVDAREQVARAIRFHTDLFGHRPNGLWPPEGGVSNLVVPIVAVEGLRWMASDEEVLARSLGVTLTRDKDGLLEQPEVVYRAYELQSGGARVRMLFRDHVLSDRIGFVYQSWAPADAAGDFLWRVGESGRRFASRTGGEDATIAVILDGENAWEHYPGGGRPFLRELYRRLEAARDIEAVTMSEAVSGGAEPLAHLFAGSWIQASFRIWAGHADDRRAWAQLSRVRSAYDTRAPFVTAEARQRAYDELCMAEGSDWFWWYGDDHSSAQDEVFDELFRCHLRQAYEALGVPPPAELHQSNRSVPPAPGAGGTMTPAEPPAGAQAAASPPSPAQPAGERFDSSR